MPLLLQQYQELILTLLKKLYNLLITIGIFYPSGEPTFLGGEGRLLCCDPFAVDYHSCMDHASHLQQAWLVNNPG